MKDMSSKTEVTENAVRGAIDRLSRLREINWIPMSPPIHPDPGPREEAPNDLLLRAGASVVPALEAAIPKATGTGRVALAQLIYGLDPVRGEAVIRKLRADRTKAVVNTCLVGFRSVGDWARSWDFKDEAPSPHEENIPQGMTSKTRWLLVMLGVAVLLATLWVLVGR